MFGFFLFILVDSCVCSGDEKGIQSSIDAKLKRYSVWEVCDNSFEFDENLKISKFQQRIKDPLNSSG